MTTEWLYRYPPLLPGTLLKRYKRFFADIQLASGEVITAHCPNTGPMTCISTVGSPVQVSQSDRPHRKLPYTWEMIQVCDPLAIAPSGEVLEPGVPTWVGVNTALPNRVVNLVLEQHLLPQLGSYDEIQPEVPYGSDGKSRIDFRLLGGDRPIYVEVKSTTWVEGKFARFPDTVTSRGQKHLRELMALLPETRGVMLYFINRGDRANFAPGDQTDPVYGQLLRQAITQGLEVLPCRFEITPVGIRYLGLATPCLA
ncbi:XRE family transcriptional regulator [Neosynechococcus sphagnicola sy1]|uniref:Sugar fermentation stimulation protein homolog n=1 Tax=Neosynechococcus sphagnicola sy1 TaxID=1497020 RepID=A0A098TJJ9_9CYAN|nr:DNA/RNA nuclease SfsA [Neosynechococcus sphagnicola]KGF72351.1 XRE family transcriptional regulator [Neosynechococcus sphagnicola sy1]